MARGKILIVDDEPTNRVILGAQLRHLGYETVEAGDGREAVTVARREQPDIVFMDIMMPGMDGYEATRLIKQEAGERHVPVIFLTALTAEEDMVKGLEVGGDDFLVKPVSFALLQARLNAVERIRQLNHTLLQQTEIMRRDEQLAEELFSGVITAQNDEMEKFGVMYLPAMTFSGDLILSARSPTGELHVLMGDFTGHGLYAAIGAMPLAQIFHSMTAKGYGPVSILAEMNRKLFEILPTEMFCAACIASISPDVRNLQIWNGGLPEALLVRGHDVVARFPSASLPLGVIEDLIEPQMQHHVLTPGDHLIIMTDGVTEARNAAGEMFGNARVEAAIASGKPAHSPFARLYIEVESFIQGQPQQDDISLLCIPCDAGIAAPAEAVPVEEVPVAAVDLIADRGWELRWELEADVIRRVDPVPMVLNQIHELAGREPDPHLFTILSELYNNAVDHGLLGLDSRQKNSADGFASFLLEREARLDALEQGRVSIEIVARPDTEGHCRLRIRVEDSGSGFDYAEVRARLEHHADTALSGRGLLLVERLCEELIVHPPGNRVEAVYAA